LPGQFPCASSPPSMLNCQQTLPAHAATLCLQTTAVPPDNICFFLALEASELTLFLQDAFHPPSSVSNHQSSDMPPSLASSGPLCHSMWLFHICASLDCPHRRSHKLRLQTLPVPQDSVCFFFVLDASKLTLYSGYFLPTILSIESSIIRMQTSPRIFSVELGSL